MKKVCSRCGDEKDLTTEFFGRCSKNKSGFNGICKECKRIERSTPENKLKQKEYDARPAVKAKKKAHYASPEYKAKHKAYRAQPEIKLSIKNYHDTPEVRSRVKAYRSTSEYKAKHKALYSSSEYKDKRKRDYLRPEVTAKKKAYNSLPETKARLKAYTTSPEYKIKRKAYQASPEARITRDAYRSRPDVKAKLLLRDILKRTLTLAKANKVDHTQDILGYTSQELTTHLNRGEYTWDDYMGEGDFHIDHIVPLAYFIKKMEVDDEGNPTDEGLIYIRLANSLENLRVWPAKDNMTKHNTLDMVLVEKHNLYHLL